MLLNAQDKADLDFLIKNAEEGRLKKISYFDHLSNYIGLLSYIRIAQEIEKILAPQSKILDWGCGMGQMSFLLKARSFLVTSYDVKQEFSTLPDIALTRQLVRILGDHPTKLPFETGSFSAVLSCGVLEHVDEFSQPGNEINSLKEIHRILEKNGKLLIYQLPQQLSWQEAVVRFFNLGYAHKRRYSANEISQILVRVGFNVVALNRTNLIPKNLTGFPQIVKSAYSKFSAVLIIIDNYLCKVPFLNRFAGALEVVALKI